MSVHPTWFGGDERPLFGSLHVPDDRRARAAIVCCTSIGTEATAVHQSMRLLACQLEQAGFAVLRFDYGGAGDSAGEAGDDVGAWRESLSEALDVVRRLGAPQVGLIGLRVGALLAALHGVTDRTLAAVALWDPCASGKAFIREQRALAALTLDATHGRVGTGVAPGSLDLLGWVLGPEGRLELETLSMEGLEPPAPHCLLLPRDDRPVPKILGPLCEHPGVECVPAVGQGELIDVLPNVSKVPVATLRAITAWFDRVMGRSRQPIRVVTKTDTRVPVARSAAVRESVQRLGAAGIFAIVTDEPEQVHGATVVLLNAGVIPHTGPARLWVTLARQLATRGVRVVRLDLSGVGESPAREGQTPHLAHPIEAMDDLSMVLDGLGVDAEDAVIAGLCSGAYHAIEAGLRMPLRGVCAINPILSFDPPEVKAGEKLARERQAVAPFNGPIKRLRRISGLAAWGEHRAPPMLWWLLDKTGVQAHPGHGFEELARRGIPVALLCGEVEARPFLRRARWSFEALLRSGALTWDLLRHDDHNLFGADAREHAHGLILDRLTDLATTRTDVSVSASRAADKTNLVSSLHTA